MTRRRYLLLAVALALLCASGLLYLKLRPCKLCDAEKAMGARLGIEPNLNIIDDYLSQEIAVGRSKEQVFALLDRAKPDSVKPTHALANESTVPNGVCYHVTFDTVLDGYRVLNRYMCIDGKGILFYVVHDLELW